jgi:two-component system chemotaxis sensor kinase CheA
LPLTLAIVRALLVQVGAHTYAVPSAQIIEAVDAEHTPATVYEGREMVTVRADTLPLVRLRVRFGGADTRTIVTDGVTDGPTVLVLEAAGRRVACEVDGLLGQQDIVVKSFAPLRNASPWFSGATILGDGSPALIVDVGNLA